MIDNFIHFAANNFHGVSVLGNWKLRKLTTPAFVQAMAAIQKCKLVQQSPYSFDVAPAGCYLFPKMKKELSGCHFGCDDDIIAAED